MENVTYIDWVVLDSTSASALLDMGSGYTKYTFSMFGGEIEHVTMIFQKRMMRAVMGGMLWS